MNEYSKKYTNNKNSEQEMILIQNEKNEDEEDEDEDDNEKEMNKNPFKNIGKNIIYKNKYIFGIKSQLFDLISLSLYFFLIYIIFIIFIFPFFYSHKFMFIYVIIIVSITTSLSIASYYQILCFITEPGIIPRKYPSLKIKDFTEKIIYSKVTKKPIIRIQRNCAICSIKRPKKCQHCFFCDNCIEEFEHHCQYVSNCIGKRNKKYFLFFIFFNFIFLIQIYTISFFQFCFSFKIYKDNLLEIYNKIYLSIIFLGIIISLSLANIFFSFDYKGYLIYLLYLTNLFFIISFYFTKSGELPKFISPFNIVFLNLLFKWLYYFLMQIMHQMKMISFNMTSSQYRNLISYLKVINNDQSYLKLSDNNDKDIDEDESDRNDFLKCIVIKDIPVKKEIPKFNISDLIKNLKNILFKDISPSLIYQEAKYY